MEFLSKIFWKRYAPALLVPVFIVAIVVILNSSVKVSRADSNGLSGYAWSSNIGWVSLNCADQNVCSASNYEVSMDPSTGNLSGYAWSSNIGWINFAPTGTYPATPYNSVVISPSTGIASGWMRALSYNKLYDDGWDGWIKITDASTTMGTTGKVLNGWAWGGVVVGWLNFQNVVLPVSTTTSQYYACTTGGSCIASSTGAYASLGSCESACTVTPTTTPQYYACTTGGSCIASSTGAYASLGSCESACTALSTHLECSGNSCVSVSGVGADQCTDDSNCGTAATHLACSGTTCTSVTGTGTDQCTTDADCGGGGVPQEHLACVDNACTMVLGGGGNQDGCVTTGDACSGGFTVCGPGTQQACASKPPNACGMTTLGTETCTSDGGAWGSCTATSSPPDSACTVSGGYNCLSGNTCEWVSSGWTYSDQTSCQNSCFTILPGPVRISQFYATPSTAIIPPESATLSWTSSGATSCSINQGIGAEPVNSNASSPVVVSPTTGTTYTLTCIGSGGSATANVTVPVGGAGVHEIMP